MKKRSQVSLGGVLLMACLVVTLLSSGGQAATEEKEADVISDEKVESRQSALDIGYRFVSDISDGFSRTIQALFSSPSNKSRGSKIPKTPGKFQDTRNPVASHTDVQNQVVHPNALVNNNGHNILHQAQPVLNTLPIVQNTGFQIGPIPSETFQNFQNQVVQSNVAQPVQNFQNQIVQSNVQQPVQDFQNSAVQSIVSQPVQNIPKQIFQNAVPNVALNSASQVAQTAVSQNTLNSFLQETVQTLPQFTQSVSSHVPLNNLPQIVATAPQAGFTNFQTLNHQVLSNNQDHGQFSSIGGLNQIHNANAASNLNFQANAQPLLQIQANQPSQTFSLNNGNLAAVTGITNVQKPSIHLSAPNDLSSERFITSQFSNAKGIGKTILNPTNTAGHDDHHHHHHHDHGSHHTPQLNTGQLLSQLIASSLNGTAAILPSETVIHLNTGSSDESTEDLSFKQTSKKDIKQKLHFGGWVGVTDTAVNQIPPAFKNTASAFETNHRPSLNSPFPNSPIITLKPIFIPPNRLIPPNSSGETTNARFKSEGSPKDGNGHIVLGSNVVIQNGGHPQGDSSLLQPPMSMTNVHNLEHLELVSKGRGQNQNGQLLGNGQQSGQAETFRPGKQPQSKLFVVPPEGSWDILSAFTNIQSPLGKNLNPTQYGVHQTLQTPNFENNQARPGSKSLTNQFTDFLPDSGISVQQHDDTGTLSFTQVIDNADPSQVLEAQKLITAIPSINISELLKSSDNSTHTFDTQLILKSLLSFRKKPCKIDSLELTDPNDQKHDFFNNLPAQSVSFNSFVTPQPIESINSNIFSHFQNKQGPKLTQPFLSAFGEKRLTGSNLGTGLQPPKMADPDVDSVEPSLSSSRGPKGRRVRDNTRFHKVNTVSNDDIPIDTDSLWRVRNTNPLVSDLISASQTLSGGMAPPPLPRKKPSTLNTGNAKSTWSEDWPNIRNNQAHQSQLFALPPPPSTDTLSLIRQNGPLHEEQLQQEEKLQTGASKHEVEDTSLDNQEKQFASPQLQLQPPVGGNEVKITPKPQHQFPRFTAPTNSPNNHILGDVTNLENPSNAVFAAGNQDFFTTPIPVIESFANPIVQNDEFGTNTHQNSHQTTLFQGQLANFPTIIVSNGNSQGTQNLQQQSNILSNFIGQPSSPFAILTPSTQFPTVAQQPPINNFFRQANSIQGGSLPEIQIQNQETNNLEGGGIVLHQQQFPVQNNAFQFLNQPQSVPSFIPITAFQRITQAPEIFSSDIETDTPNLFGNLPLNTNTFGAINSLSGIPDTAVETQISIQNHFPPHVLSSNIFGANINTPIVNSNQQNIVGQEDQQSVGNPITVETNLNAGQGFFNTPLRSSDALNALPNPNNPGANDGVSNGFANTQQFQQTQIFSDGTNNPQGVTNNAHNPNPFNRPIFLTTSLPPRLVPINSNIDISNLPSSLPGLTSNTVLGPIQTVSEVQPESTAAPQAPPQQVRITPRPRFRNRETFTQPAEFVSDASQFVFSNEFGTIQQSTADSIEPEQPATARPQVPFVVPFNPWPSRRLKGSDHSEAIGTDSDEVAPPQLSATTNFPWPSFRQQSTTTVAPPPSSTTTEVPQQESTNLSVFEQWLRNRAQQASTTPAPPPPETQPPVPPQNLNPRFQESILAQNNLGGSRRQPHAWRSRSRTRISPLVNKSHQFEVAETNVQEVTVSPTEAMEEDVNTVTMQPQTEIPTTEMIRTKRRKIVTLKPRPTIIDYIDYSQVEDDEETYLDFDYPTFEEAKSRFASSKIDAVIR